MLFIQIFVYTLKKKKVSTKVKNKGQIHIKSAVIFNSQCVKLIKREPVALLASFLSHSFSNTVTSVPFMGVFKPPVIFMSI